MPPLPEPLNHTVNAIYAAYEARPTHERTYLGMSTFGTECDRAFWYAFRHAHSPEQLEGRKRRLFQTGHREEARIIEDLRAAGMTVDEEDPTTGRQWEVIALGGHVRGHLDGIVSNVPEAPKTEHVLEVKTHNDRSFKALLKDKVEKARPGHFAQMQLYMHHKGLTRALYIAVNKNDDALYSERVEYDAAAALRLLARAERIVSADAAPSRLHDDPKAKAAFACQWCPALPQCHEGAAARRNCRTCISSTPVLSGADGGWHCAFHDKALSSDEQQAGCPAHLFLPSLVPGEQIDASAAERWVDYRMRDGEIWRNAGRVG